MFTYCANTDNRWVQNDKRNVVHRLEFKKALNKEPEDKREERKKSQKFVVKQNRNYRNN